MSFLHDPLSDIQLIANNLRDRYKSGFPILKEIVQNADDAKAENLVLGWHPGIQSATHPLLRDPAVFFINDAPLTDADVKGIRTLGLGSKAGDTNAVGKFGLGMKSLFHLGELYFFIGSDWQDHTGKYSKANVLNPWGDERPSWNNFSDDDKHSLQQELESITTAFGDGAYKFIVWIPLRSASIASERGENGNNYIYTSDDYGREIPPFLLDTELATQLGQLVPMLKSLRTVTGCFFSVANKSFTKLFSTEINAPSERLRFPNLTDETQWHGSINVYGGRDELSSTLSYVGTEVSLQSESLKKLKENEFWPISYARNAAGEEQKISDKAQPHSATVLLGQPVEEKAKLTVRWAVFLPLGEQDTSEVEQVFETRIEGNMSFDILLHGYFFIDAGRVGIHGRKYIGTSTPLEINSEDTATQEWNRLLANQGTLPRVLTSVSQAVSKLKLTQLQVEELSGGLVRFFNSDMGRNCLLHITSSNQWVYQVSKEFKGWVLIPSSRAVRRLPLPKGGDFERAWSTFPNLFSFKEDLVFVDDSKPNICSLKDVNWQESEVVELLKSVPSEVFESSKQLGYLNDFLREAGSDVGTSACQLVLVKLAQTALHSVELFKLSKNQSAFKEFVGFIRPTYRWSVKVEKDEQALWDLFASVGTSKLFLPAFLDIGNSTTTLDFDDADQLFIQLGRCELTDNQLSKATDAVLESLEVSQKNALIQRHDSLKLFSAYLPGSHKPYRESSSNLKVLFQKRRLFSRASLNSGSFLLGGSLSAALADNSVVFINDKVNQQLFDKKVKPCDTKPILDLLAKRPPLSEPKTRTVLISKLEINDHLDMEQRLSIRYLMHGSALDRNTSQALWSVGGDDAVWSRLHRESLSDDERWTIIPHEISTSLKLSNQEKNILNLQEVNARNVIDTLGEDIQLVDFSNVALSPSDAEEILKYIGDKDIWCNLPLHQSLSGEFCSIEYDCLLQSNLDLPRELHDAITWIAPAISRDVQNQQDLNIPKLDACKSIELALDQDVPSKYQSLILEMLGKLSSCESILEKLKSTRWLVADDLVVSPNMVVLADRDIWNVTHQLCENSRDFCFAESLEIFNEPSFDTIKAMLVSNDFDIAYLALKSAAKLPDYFVGQGNVTRHVLKQASQYRTLFKKAELKGWEILIECFSNTQEGSLNEEWLKSLERSVMSSESLIHVHEGLVKEATSAKAISELRYALLTMICNQNSPLQDIAKLSLRSLNDEFISSKRLCHGIVGVTKSATLHDDDYKAIEHLLSKNDEPKVIDDAYFEQKHHQDLDPKFTTSSADEIKKYFSDWEPFITNKTAIATVLALVSGTPGVRELCEYYLGQHSYRNFINEIGKNWVVEKSQGYSRVPESLAKFVSLMKFNIQITSDNTKIVMSLFNEEIEVELESDVQSIFVWDTKRFASPITVHVRKLPVIEIDEPQLLMILKNSAEIFLKKIYGQSLSLDHIWDAFSGAEQLDIRAAKLTVMDGIVYQLKELHLNDPKLSKLLKEYDHLVTSAAENHQNVGGEEKGKILEKICQQVETKNVKAQVLAAVKHKIEQAQYHSHSIPFELFQNADDAVVELKKLGLDDSEVDRRGVFKVNATERKITFFNWGREVNQYRSSSSAIDGTQFGFKTDLQKMIVRNQSDKDDVTTGKFGLGFKSCLLVADTPNIVSGRLAVQIEGGLLPSVSPDHDALFQLAKSEMLEGGIRPTVISLPLRKGIECSEVLSRFRKQAGLLTIFSKRIHTIEIDGELFQWHPINSVLIDGVTLGTVRIPTKKRNSDVRVVVVSTASGIFVFGLGDKGFKALNRELPKLWNLSPLMGEFSIGFAINASFDVDIGRNQLAISSQRNSALFESLGQELSAFLSRLYLQCKYDWSAVKAEWNLSDDLEVSAFWGSIWNTLQVGATSTSRFIEGEDVESHKNYTNRLFTSEGGILSFYRSHQAFPVGMKGSDPRLVSLASVSYRAGELLDNMLKHVAKLPVLSELLEAQKIVGFEVGKSLLALGVEVTTLELGELIERTLEDNYLSPSSAEQLRHVFDSNFDRKLKKNKATQEQVDQFRTKLSELIILVENGSHRSVKESLIRKAEATTSDEAMVIDFAPSEYITSSQYSDYIGFIELCRRDVTPYNFSILFDWVCRREVESSPHKQQAICRYLVGGSFGEALANEIKKASKPGWIFNIDVQHLKSWGWNKKQIDLFRNVRMITDAEIDNRVNSQLKSEGRSQLSTQDSLMRIYEWWEDEGPKRLEDYEKELYPGGSFDWLAIRQDEQPERYHLAWLKLFFLGSCQTIGRSKEVQHMRALEHFENKGWWAVFSDANNPIAWFDVMDQYLLDAVTSDKYRTWLQILPLYRFSNHLDKYIDLFWSADNGLPRIDALLRPGSSAELSGAGRNFAPPELKATLGIGANFILRELYRNDIYTDEALEQHCFVASRGVRDLLSQRLPDGPSLSDPSAKSSQEIYQYLCTHLGEDRATFGGAFDIPFRILSRSENTPLLEEILDIGVWS